jgi:hypothetical protein
MHPIARFVCTLVAVGTRGFRVRRVERRTSGTFGSSAHAIAMFPAFDFTKTGRTLAFSVARTDGLLLWNSPVPGNRPDCGETCDGSVSRRPL